MMVRMLRPTFSWNDLDSWWSDSCCYAGTAGITWRAQDAAPHQRNFVTRIEALKGAHLVARGAGLRALQFFGALLEVRWRAMPTATSKGR